jgi:hypothetical protein
MVRLVVVGATVFGLGVWVGVMVAPVVAARAARREWLEADREAETFRADVHDLDRASSAR